MKCLVGNSNQQKKLPVRIMFAKFQESMRLPGVDRWGVETYMHIHHQ